MTSIRHEFQAMTTRCLVQFDEADAARAPALARRIEARVAALVRRWNFHDPASWLSRSVNRRGGRWVELDDEAAHLLRQVREAGERTLGAFDITGGTWAQALRQCRTAEALAELLARREPAVGLDAWRLHGRRLELPHPETRLDLGGVIKEYAVDEALRLCRQAGLRSALVNFGGDVGVIGRKADGQRWVAAVPHPARPDQMLFALDLEDQSLTTSAHYARHRRLADGTLLSHIPRASQGASRWISASVISRSTLCSGFLSTALLVRDDFALAEGCMAVVVDRDARVRTLEPQAPQPAATLNTNDTRSATTCA